MTATTFGSAALWLLPALPALVGVALCCAGRHARRPAVAVSLSTAALVLALVFIVDAERAEVAVPFLAGSSFGLAVDGLSALMLLMVAVVTLLVLIFAAAEGIESPARFHGLMLLFLSAVLITATATTVPTLLFAWEIMGATSYALIGFRWRDDHRVSSGLIAFLVTRVGDLGLYGAAGAAVASGGLSLAHLDATGPGWRDAIAAGFLVAALGKAAQLPFSFWLSRAMDGPSPVSALLHSAAMVAMGGYLLLRVEPLLAATGWAATTAAWLGAGTALILGAIAVAQRDLKQLLAASTAAQLGFVVLAAGVGSVAGGADQLMAHAATKALLFLAAGAWLAALGTKQLSALAGAARRWPVVGVTFAAGALSLAGLPPLSLWAAKDTVLAGALSASPALYVVGLAAAALSAAYAGKALFILWRRHEPHGESANDTDAHGTDAYDTEQAGTRHVGRWEQVPLVVLAAAAAVLGVLALPPLSGWIGQALGGTAEATPGVLELVASGLLAVVMLCLVAWKGAPEPSWALSWLGMEWAARRLIAQPVLALAEQLARFDDRFIDAAVTGVARGGQRLASAAAHFDISGVDYAVRVFGRFVEALGRLARRPQTGQLHQYYAQAAAVLVLAVILLLTVR